MLKAGDRLVWFKFMGRAKWQKTPVTFVKYSKKSNLRCYVEVDEGDGPRHILVGVDVLERK